MLSRALSLATAVLLIGFATVSVQAQNLEAGKSPAQLFSGNCSVCHKSARGLLKSVPPGSLPSFLRQHYTTSNDMAQSMAAFVIANGAGGNRRPNDDNLTRQGRELIQTAPADAAPGRRQRPAAAERPDAAQPEAEQGTRRGRNARRQPPAEPVNPEAARPAGEQPVEAERPAAQKQKVGKKGRRHQEEAPKAEPAKDAPKVEPKPDADKAEPPKDAAPAKPVEDSKPAAAPEPRSDPAPATRADPVPDVTPAPKAAAPEPSPAAPQPAAPEPAPKPSGSD